MGPASFHSTNKELWSTRRLKRPGPGSHGQWSGQGKKDTYWSRWLKKTRKCIGHPGSGSKNLEVRHRWIRSHGDVCQFGFCKHLMRLVVTAWECVWRILPRASGLNRRAVIDYWCLLWTQLWDAVEEMPLFSSWIDSTSSPEAGEGLPAPSCPLAFAELSTE